MKLCKLTQRGLQSFGTRQHHWEHVISGKGKSYVPLDRALLNSYRLSNSVYSNHSTICNGLAAICSANFNWDSNPQISPLCGGLGPLSSTVIFTWDHTIVPAK